MGRKLLWTFGVGAVLVFASSPVTAQTHIDVGIVTPSIGARVVLGRPAIVVPPHVVVAPPGRRGGRVHRGYAAVDDRYWRDRERAERKYRRDLEKARREYEKNLRKANRHRW